jgi:hypothetical protein
MSLVGVSTVLHPRSRLSQTALAVATMKAWPARRWAAAVAAGTLVALATGIPTGIVETSFYTRMTPVTWWNYPVWALSAILAGLTAATYVRVSRVDAPAPGRPARSLGAVVLTTFAVGCPICNKLVVALIGVSGALSYWAPIQPALGVASIALLGAGLAIRLNGSVACAT